MPDTMPKTLDLAVEDEPLARPTSALSSAEAARDFLRNEIDSARPGEAFYRHRLPVRITHWINALCILFLLGSGLNIFNAHPRLYWGKYGADADRALLSIGAVDRDGTPAGVTQVGPWSFNT